MTIRIWSWLLALGVLDASLAQSPPDLSRQIAEVLSQGPATRAHQRFVHSKGIVCQGIFEASPPAATISRAAHLAGGRVPAIVRFSDGGAKMAVADNSTDAAPRGIAVRIGNGRGTDITSGDTAKPANEGHFKSGQRA